MAKSSLVHANSGGSTLYAVLSLNVLQSLDNDKIVALHSIGISSLGDLLHFKPIIYAQILTAIANREIGHDISVARYLDKAYVNTSIGDISQLPIIAVRGVGATVEVKINQAFAISTIKELAVFPPFMEAQQYLLPDKDVFNERPSAPEDLMPKILGNVASVARYNSYIKSELIGIGNDEILLEALNKDELNSELYEIFTTSKIRFYTGYVAGFTQKWVNMGTHLGEVIHSLALAPGESRNISIIEWYRRQSSNRDEKTIVDEKLSNSLVHSRALNEVVKTTAMEHLAGNSSMEASTKTTGFGLTAGGAAGSSSGSSLSADLSSVVGFPLKAASSMLSSIAGSIGVSGVYSNNQQVGTLQSESSGTREVLGETQQNIKESTLQNSSNIRSIYSTVVVTDEQSEKETIQTKNVTNYNHSHALTIQYYEVLQRYEVLLQLESWTPVVYLPFKPIKFNISIVLKYWHLLGAPVMSSFSDLFERYNNFLKGYTPTNTNFNLSPNVKVTKIKITASSNGAPYLYQKHQSPGGFGMGQNVTKSINKPADAFQITINQPPTASLPYLAFPVNEMILSTPQINLSDLGGLYLKWTEFPHPPSNSQDENSFKIDMEFTLLDANGNITTIIKSYSKTLKIQEFFNAHFTPISLSNNISNDIESSFNSTAQSTSVELKNEIEKHFNTHKYAYTRFLLSSIEGDQLSDIVESLFFDSPGRIFIENYIYPNPIAITENYLVFKHKKLPIPSNIENPCDSTEFEGFNDPIWTALLKLRCNVENYKNNKDNRTIDTVFLPTAGVFAEAILGRSNASEYVDPRRFWNWQDSPIPFSAPQIAAITAGNHVVNDQSSALTPNVPASNLNIINPPQYALPNTLATALQAVQNGNMFRDMSKTGELVSILGNLANLASTTATLAGNLSGEAAANALNGAVELGKQVAGMVNKATDSWASKNIASPPSSQTEKAAAFNAQEYIKDNPHSNEDYSTKDEGRANIFGVSYNQQQNSNLLKESGSEIEFMLIDQANWNSNTNQVIGTNLTQLLQNLSAFVLQNGNSFAQRNGLPSIGIMAHNINYINGVATFFSGFAIIGTIFPNSPHPSDSFGLNRVEINIFSLITSNRVRRRFERILRSFDNYSANNP